MIRYVAFVIGAALLLWLGYLFTKAVPAAGRGESGARLSLFFNGLGFVAVLGFLTFIITAFQE
ncbi:hypothetical protein GH975_10215 [Litorivicinus lipolyticus]|uniref:Uncharacterized protein n=1 Tax=Litorivicinus lipolyticus TaxID=418701 RepID=A0A5Q2QEX4_9GAMM|nr:hypothetical protein [Litorivicinus lipolyticus]QGG80921.1 hypothetical protein GH975_10215 [Litorivicinus lipolyticus]